MEKPDKPMSLVVACKHFFGFKHGQTMSEFMNEIRELNDAEKAEFKRLLQGIGYTITG